MAFFERLPDLMYLRHGESAASWQGVIPDAAGQGEKFFAEVERRVKDAGVPSVLVERKQLESFRPGQSTKKLNPRVALCISAEPFGGYKLYIGAHDYGKHLLVSRYLYVSNTPREGWNVFETEELSACLSLMGSAFMDAVEQMMGELNHDFSKINSKGQGIIDIT